MVVQSDTGGGGGAFDRDRLRRRPWRVASLLVSCLPPPFVLRSTGIYVAKRCKWRTPPDTPTILTNQRARIGSLLASDWFLPVAVKFHSNTIYSLLKVIFLLIYIFYVKIVIYTRNLTFIPFFKDHLLSKQDSLLFPPPLSSLSCLKKAP